ncbi:MAG: alanine--tRNA ligase [Thermoprotei archaeon]|jgi:alanyl-tRNA synthetase
MEFSVEEYEIPFFKEMGFVRKKCPSCGAYFWTLNKNRKTCGEAPCDPYTFIGKKNFSKTYNLKEMRNAFLKFFESYDHKIIKPYPVVARWRDDLYLTIASIAVFQPFVTNGSVPPPANPLVISQPCIRLLDLDHVGPTAGRHLSIFEMGGHHAFNYPNKKIYWKDETVRFFHQFATEILGIDPIEITYKEGVWEGGGNAGPDFEVIYRGLEIATLVFMQYKVTEDGQYIEIPLKVVDTGYGIERFTWMSQGTPSAFHSIYEDLLSKLLSKANISVDMNLLQEHARNSALLLGNKYSPKDVKIIIAKGLGLNVEETISILTKIESIYAILDHSKALLFMLSDGLVPSNSGEGYLGRLLARKILRHIRYLNLDITLKELLLWQMDYWKSQFPNVTKNRDKVLEMSEIEENKYEESISKGITEVIKTIKEIKKANSSLELDKLIELYDSHGIHPDLVSEIAKKEGIAVETPNNFYSIISSKHLKPAPKIVREPDVNKFPVTRTLYYEDQYLRSFKAKIIGIVNNGLIFDQTAFYPEGGGQISDTGIIKIGNEQIKIVNVQKYGHGVIVHYTDRKEIDKNLINQTIEGVIDWDRRLALMRHHTSVHIIIASARKILGDHVWQAGSYVSPEYARLDITHYKRITKEEVEKIEQLANNIVLSNIKVTSKFIDRQKAEKKYGFTLYQGGVLPGSTIRVVSIGNFDHEADGGTHVKRTGELGLIKIIKVDKIQDGVERLIFVAGKEALNKFQELENIIRNISSQLETSEDKVLEGITKIINELKNNRSEIDRLRSIYAETITNNLLNNAETIGRIKFVSFINQKLSTDDIISIGNEIIKKDINTVAVLITGVQKISAVVVAGKNAINLGINAGELAKLIGKHIKGGGGGKAELGQAGGTEFKNVNQALENVREVLRKYA